MLSNNGRKSKFRVNVKTKFLWTNILWRRHQHKLMGENVNLSDINYLKNIFMNINKIIYKCSPLIKITFTNIETSKFIIYSPTKVKHHLTCFNNIFSNNELISNRFAVFVTCTHTYLHVKQVIDRFLLMCIWQGV